MDRRLLLAGLAASSVIPAFAKAAQSDPPAAETPTPGAKPSTAAPAPAEVMGLGDAEKAHLVQTMKAGSFSLRMSKMAAGKLQHDKLKAFAELEIAEQETVGDVLNAIKAAANDTSPPPALDADQNAALQKLEQVSGDSLDREYLKAQMDGHKQLLKIQEQYLAAGKNLDSTNVAKLARGMIKEHLKLLGDLEKSLTSL